jgi:hypothetical protein
LIVTGVGGLRLASFRVDLVDVGSVCKPGDRDVADVGDREVGVQRLREDDPVPRAVLYGDPR